MDGKPMDTSFKSKKSNFSDNSVNTSRHFGEIEGDNNYRSESVHSSESLTEMYEYMQKPTIIMCNPNALVY